MRRSLLTSTYWNLLVRNLLCWVLVLALWLVRLMLCLPTILCCLVLRNLLLETAHCGQTLGGSARITNSSPYDPAASSCTGRRSMGQRQHHRSLYVLINLLCGALTHIISGHAP